MVTSPPTEERKPEPAPEDIMRSPIIILAFALALEALPAVAFQPACPSTRL